MDDSQETEPEGPAPHVERVRRRLLLLLWTVRQLAARSHRGGRPVNDDHFLIVELGRHQRTIATNLPDGDVPVRFEEHGYGMIVADGLGRAAATASRLAITTLANLVLRFGKWQLRIDPETADDVINRARRFYHQVDRTVTETVEQAEYGGPGRTCTAGAPGQCPEARRSFARESSRGLLALLISVSTASPMRRPCPRAAVKDAHGDSCAAHAGRARIKPGQFSCSVRIACCCAPAAERRRRREERRGGPRMRAPLDDVPAGEICRRRAPAHARQKDMCQRRLNTAVRGQAEGWRPQGEHGF